LFEAASVQVPESLFSAARQSVASQTPAV